MLEDCSVIGGDRRLWRWLGGYGLGLDGGRSGLGDLNYIGDIGCWSEGFVAEG